MESDNITAVCWKLIMINYLKIVFYIIDVKIKIK